MQRLTHYPDAEGPAGERILVRRSSRRRRTVDITRRNGELIVAIPDRFSAREEREWVQRMIERLAMKERRAGTAHRSDDDLQRLADDLSGRYLDGRARPHAVRWSARQERRWGSCTPSTGEIRLSTRLQGMPAYVIESVLVHELAHLLEPGHGPGHRALTDRYPNTERADAFLAGVAWARDMPVEPSQPSAECENDADVEDPASDDAGDLAPGDAEDLAPGDAGDLATGDVDQME